MMARMPTAVSFALALSLLVVTPTVAQAQPAPPSPTVFLDDLTWTELRDQLRAGKTTIIVPIGGTEQNGPAMALGKHNVRIRVLAEKIAQGLGNALVAPVVAYVPEGSIEPPTAHMRFPGTVTVPERTFESLLESAARSFRHHGFRDIIFLGDHGGYQKNQAAVADRLNRAWSAGVTRAHAVPEYYRAIESEYPRLLRQRGFGGEEIGSHAGLADTSLMLAVDPRLVRTDRLGGLGAARAEGVYGDPRRASAELGRPGVDLIVERSIDAIRKATLRR